LATKSFKIGDKVVYPGHGVGEISTIKSRNIAGTEQQFFEILVIETGMRIMVPVAQSETVGLRRVIDKKAIDKVYAILKDRNFKVDTQTWNRRFREYSQKIKTGSVFEIAEVLRDLSVLGSGKELSFGEKKMLDMAQNLLVSEIAIAKARPQERIIGELQEIFA
jgi:CarD family transcriptional regulator